MSFTKIRSSMILMFSAVLFFVISFTATQNTHGMLSPASKAVTLKKLEQYSEIMNHQGSAKSVSRDLLYKTVLAKFKKFLPKSHKSKAHDLAREVFIQSEKYQMDPLFLLAVMKTESSFNPSSVGSSGELGLMQLRPKTGAWIAKKYDIQFNDNADLIDPVKNIRLGSAYLDYLRTKFKKSARSYIAAYNMGPRNVRRLEREKITPSIYSSKVIRHYASIHDSMTH